MEEYRVPKGKNVALKFQALAVFILLLTTGSPLTRSVQANFPNNTVSSDSIDSGLRHPTINSDPEIPLSFLGLFTVGVLGLILLARVIQNVRRENRVYLHHRHSSSMLDSHRK